MNKIYIIFYMPGGRYIVAKISDSKETRFHNLLMKEWGELIPSVVSGETWDNWEWNTPIFDEDTPYDARSLTLDWRTGQMFAKVTRHGYNTITLHPTKIYIIYNDRTRIYKEPPFANYKAEGYFLSKVHIPINTHQ